MRGLAAPLLLAAMLAAACGGGGQEAPAAADAAPASSPSGGAGASAPLSDLGVPGPLVYTAGVDLLIADAAGVRPLVRGNNQLNLIAPAFSPDGATVAYVRYPLLPVDSPDPPGSDLHLITVATGEDRVLRQHTRDGEFYWAPRFTPDGGVLIVDHQVNETDAQGRPFLVDIERLDLATGTATVLRKHARDGALSPDGSRLVYVDDPARTQVHALALAGADGANPVTLLDFSDNLAIFRRPQFSPDGAWIAFLASGDGPLAAARPGGVDALTLSVGNGVQDLWLIRPDGSGLRRLTVLLEDLPDFDWSADGRHILLRGAFGTYLVEVATATALTLGAGEFHPWHDWLGNAPAPGGDR